MFCVSSPPGCHPGWKKTHRLNETLSNGWYWQRINERLSPDSHCFQDLSCIWGRSTASKLRKYINDEKKKILQFDYIRIQDIISAARFFASSAVRAASLTAERRQQPAQARPPRGPGTPGGHACGLPARAKPPARRGDLCPSVSCDTPPVFVLKFTRDGYISLPIADAGLRPSRQINYFQLQAPAGGGGGGRPELPRALAGPLPSPAPPGIWKGTARSPSDPF